MRLHCSPNWNEAGVRLSLPEDDLRYQTRSGVHIAPYRDRIRRASRRCVPSCNCASASSPQRRSNRSISTAPSSTGYGRAGRNTTQERPTQPQVKETTHDVHHAPRPRGLPALARRPTKLRRSRVDPRRPIMTERGRRLCPPPRRFLPCCGVLGPRPTTTP